MRLSAPAKPQPLLEIKQQPGKILAIVLNGLLVLGIAYDIFLATKTDIGINIASNETIKPAVATPLQVAKPSNGPAWHDWHPFGKPPAPKSSEPAKPAVIVPVEAPDTQLELTLTGILLASDTGRSLVAIQSASEGAKIYATGDKIAGETTIATVLPDRVILEKKGRFETLRLPKTVLPLNQRGFGAQTKPNNEAPELLKQLRAQFLVRPDDVLDKFTVAPITRNGSFVGYAINPGKESGLLEKLGLQPGDIVTQVNGVTLNTPVKGMEALGTLGQSKSLQVTVFRGGEPVTVNHAIMP
ncbi:MAG: type II secretion system protein GspC [Magnetococcus sp. YQC-5]